MVNEAGKPIGAGQPSTTEEYKALYAKEREAKLAKAEGMNIKVINMGGHKLTKTTVHPPTGPSTAVQQTFTKERHDQLLQAEARQAEANNQGTLQEAGFGTRRITPPPESLADLRELSHVSLDIITSSPSMPSISSSSSSQMVSISEQPVKKLGIRPRNDFTTTEVQIVPNMTTGEHEAHFVTRDVFSGMAERQVGTLKLNKKLASGGYARVVMMIKTVLGIEEQMIFKFGRKKMGTIGDNDVMADFEKTKRICSEGNVWGIKPPPQFMVSVPRMGPKANQQPNINPLYQVADPSLRVGYGDTKYDTDLDNWLKNSGNIAIEDALPIFHQLLNAATYMDEKGIIDDDRKIENILVREENGVQLFHFSDWGGARFSQEIGSKTLKEFLGEYGHTPHVTSKRDQHFSTILIERNNVDQYFRLEQKRVTFQLGVILYTILTKSSQPYPLTLWDNKEYLDVGAEYRPILRSDVPPELSNLIKEMLDPAYGKRPTPTQAMDRFNSILDTYPAVKQKIESDMQKLGYIS